MTGIGVAQDQLRAFVERIERLEEEKQTIADDIKEVFAEAKGNGFDVKVLRQVIRLRKQDARERAEQEAILDLYMSALGMLPLDQAADAPHSAIRAAAKSPKVREAVKGFVDSLEPFDKVSITVGDKTTVIKGAEKADA